MGYLFIFFFFENWTRGTCYFKDDMYHRLNIPRNINQQNFFFFKYINWWYFIFSYVTLVLEVFLIPLLKTWLKLSVVKRMALPYRKMPQRGWVNWKRNGLSWSGCWTRRGKSAERGSSRPCSRRPAARRKNGRRSSNRWKNSWPRRKRNQAI